MPSKTKQTTLAQTAEVEGPGLFTGEPCRLRFCPAEANTGVVFARTNADEPARIRAVVANVANRARRTTLQNDAVAIETVEHVLSAIAGLALDNVLVEVTGPEAPGRDGSPGAYVDALLGAGIVQQEAASQPHMITETVTVTDGDAMLTAAPGSDDYLDILYDMDYSQHPSVGRQIFAFRLGIDDYVQQLARARTFIMADEADALRAQGLGTHLSAQDLLVVGADGPIDNELRFADEYVRHKVCDLIGDLHLFGRPLRGRIIACKSGHALNHKLIAKLSEQVSASRRGRQAIDEPMLDIRQVQRILPHRYPFLMIDRVIELDGDRRAVGIKNVTINEPFFQGHYPGQPVMPGVLILEAMAQLSGILLSRRLDNTGKVAMLVSMDRVKIRRAARPGDQLVIETESLHVRRRTGHCRCRTMIGENLAAEAEIKFMLVDEDAT